MPRSQTRRSVSVKGLTHQRIKKHLAAKGGGSVSGFVEELIRDKLGEPDDDDRQKFGEAMQATQKGSEAKKAEDPDEQNNGFAPAIKFF